MIVPLAPEAVAAITRHCINSPGLETGGVLAETRGAVRFASGPGPDARLQAMALRWDPGYIMRWIQGCAELKAGRAMGRWHKHCTPVLNASAVDRAGASALRQALDLPSVVDLIVACGDGDTPLGWRAYLCTETEYRMIECSVPEMVPHETSVGS